LSDTNRLSAFLSFLSFFPISRLEAKAQLIEDFTSLKSCSASVLRKHKPFISKQGNQALGKKNPFQQVYVTALMESLSFQQGLSTALWSQ